MRRRSRLQPSVQGRIDIADQQAGHVCFLASAFASNCWQESPNDAWFVLYDGLNVALWYNPTLWQIGKPLANHRRCRHQPAESASDEIVASGKRDTIQCASYRWCRRSY